MPPRQMSHNLWDKFEMRAEKRVRRSHRKQAGLAGHWLTASRSPFSFTLPMLAIRSTVPIPAEQFGIHGRDRTRLRCLNAMYDGR